MKTIAPPELQRLLTAQSDLPLLDVRSPLEYGEIHIPQARNVPLDSLNPKALFEAGQLQKGQPVYLICRSGPRSLKAAEQFVQEGYEQVVIVDGGTLAWDAAGLPVNRGKAKVISLERQVRIGAGALVFTGVVLSRVVHPSFIGLPGFVGVGLILQA